MGFIAVKRVRFRVNPELTKESIIEKIYCFENLPLPLFAKEG
jgi:hypothetical protein